jgi:hypothetical protein
VESFGKQVKILPFRPISPYRTQENRVSAKVEAMNDSSEINVILNKAKTNCYNSFIDASPAEGKFCELTFDGLMCWPQTLAGVLANQSCSNEYIKSTKTVSRVRIFFKRLQTFILSGLRQQTMRQRRTMAHTGKHRTVDQLQRMRYPFH